VYLQKNVEKIDKSNKNIKKTARNFANLLTRIRRVERDARFAFYRWTFGVIESVGCQSNLLEYPKIIINSEQIFQNKLSKVDETAKIIAR
jgi:hypothetical protein